MVTSRFQINTCITPPLHPLLWKGMRKKLESVILFLRMLQFQKDKKMVTASMFNLEMPKNCLIILVLFLKYPMLFNRCPFLPQTFIFVMTMQALKASPPLPHCLRQRLDHCRLTCLPHAVHTLSHAWKYNNKIRFV